MNISADEMDMTPYCLDLGEGRPLVLLHGWCMSARVWQPLQPLSSGCRLLLPDLRGHGSFAPGASFSLDELLQDVELLFRQMDLRGAVLGGWSMGSLVALAAAPRLRDRLAGLVLLGGTPRFTETEGYPHGVPQRELRGMGTRLRRDCEATVEGFVRGMFAPGELLPGEAEAVTPRLQKGAPPLATALAGLELLGSADMRGALEGISLPALVIHGEEDRVCPPAAARFLARHLPEGALEILSGVGHAPFISQPESVMEKLCRFMEKLP